MLFRRLLTTCRFDFHLSSTGPRTRCILFGGCITPQRGWRLWRRWMLWFSTGAVEAFNGAATKP